MADFAEAEAINGIRMSWNVWPSTKLVGSFYQNVVHSVELVEIHVQGDVNS